MIEVEVVCKGYGRSQDPCSSKLIVADEIHLFQLFDMLVREFSSNSDDMGLRDWLSKSYERKRSQRTRSQ